MASLNIKKEKKEWTLMFYFASDNPLATGIVSQLKAIKDAGFHKEANVIAYFDPQTKKTPSHVFEVNMVEKLKKPDKTMFNFTSNDPFVRNLVFDKLWANEDKVTRERIQQYLNSKLRKAKAKDTDTDEAEHGAQQGDEEKLIVLPLLDESLRGELAPQQSLENFLTFCANNYEARHYMLFILGHGVVVGNDIFLFDANIPDPDSDQDGGGDSIGTVEVNPPEGARKLRKRNKRPQHSLTLRDLGQTLEVFKELIVGKGELELLGLHSCSMSGLEVAYEVKDCANYLLASQGPAFVGSWPYKQILMRVFNDLDSVYFKPRDIKNFASLIAQLNEDKNQQLVELLNDPRIKENNTTVEFRSEFREKLNRLLETADLAHSKWAEGIVPSKETEELIKQIKLSAEAKGLEDKRPEGIELMWLNRMMLKDAFPKAIGERREIPDVKTMLTRIFNYCIRNSYDYQLAGYSFDMALCDLSKLKQGIEDPLKKLVEALKDGLEEKDGLAKELILLAHWESQSYWQEQYTDLCDFCFRLYKKCEEYKEKNPPLQPISDACLNVMKAMKRGKEKDDNRMIVRSAFIGPAFQYSHGFSIFFPWSNPVEDKFIEQYKKYKFTRDFFPEGRKKISEEEEKNRPPEDFKDAWVSFLNTYFQKTQRRIRVAEDDEYVIATPEEKVKMAEEVERKEAERIRLKSGEVHVVPEVSEEILLGEMLQDISNSVFSGDRLDTKIGSGDPTGDACECPSIKNYPPVTIETDKGGPKTPATKRVPMSRNLYRSFTQD